MALSTKFTDEEVDYLIDICQLANTETNQTEIAAKLDDDVINSAVKAGLQRDIEEWKLIEYGTERSKGGIKGTDFSQERNRLYLTNKVRRKLGYAEISGGLAANEIGTFGFSIGAFGAGSDGDEYSHN